MLLKYVYVMTTVFRDLGQTHVGAIMHWISVCPNMQTCLQTSSDVVWWLISIVTTAISVPVNQYCDVESPSLVSPGSSMPVETIRLYRHASRPDFGSAGMPTEPICVYVTAL